MSVRSRVFAALCEPLMRSSQGNGLAELRAGLLAEARGRGLELGAGCHLDRATSAANAGAGFTLAEERQEHFPKAAGILQLRAVGRAPR